MAIGWVLTAFGAIGTLGIIVLLERRRPRSGVPDPAGPASRAEADPRDPDDLLRRVHRDERGAVDTPV